jgi:hypothetical protein
MATLGTKLVLFSGGILGGTGPSNDTWTWDGATWTRVAQGAAAAPSARNSLAMTGL